MSADASIDVVDDVGRTLRLAAPPRRIVSLVPSLTELLFTLGAGPAVVGATRYCTEPADAVAALPRVGGTKNPKHEAIRALAPDLVIMNAEENRLEDFVALAADLAVFVSEPKTVAAALDGIERLGRAVGHAAAGRALAASQRARLAAIPGPAGPPVRYFCPIWKRPWMTFNADTYADDVLRLAGGANVAAARAERYPVVTLAEIAAAAPEMVLLPDEPYPFTLADRPALAPLAATPALRNDHVHCIDGKALAWYGPRIADGVASLTRMFAIAR